MDLIYRNDCNLFDANAGIEEIIRQLMYEYGLTWEANAENNDFDEDKIYEFACELVQCAKYYIDIAPTISDSEVITYKCPECRVVSILYDPENERHCPNCGVMRTRIR